MIIDTSALIAILLDEPGSERFKDAIAQADQRIVSTVSVVEASIIALARLGPVGRVALMSLIQDAEIDIAPFDAAMANLAADAFDRFGKGRHPAALNFGDCCVYALAAATGKPILFKGGDFAATDAASAVTA